MKTNGYVYFDAKIVDVMEEKMFIFKSNMDKDFDQICEYILKLKRAELFLHELRTKINEGSFVSCDAGIL